MTAARTCRWALPALCALAWPLRAAAQPAPTTSATASAGAPSDTPPAGTAPTPTASDTPPAPPSAADATAPATDTPPPLEPPKTIDVTVGGDRPPAGSSALRRRDIREIPGVLADPYRAIEVKPGVTPTASGIPYFFIRGSPPGNIGYFFDGIQVPLLFHVGGGPSVIPAPLVQRVTFSPGPYPASQGRFAGAIVEATSTPPPQEWRGEAGLRLDVGAIVQGPVKEKLDVLVGGHWAYAAAVVEALVPSIGVGYGDYQVRLGYNPSPGERIQLLGFGSYDYLSVKEDATDTDCAFGPGRYGSLQCTEGETHKVKTTLLDADFHRIDLKYERELDGGGKAYGAVTLGLDQSRNVGVERAQDYKLAARAGLQLPLSGGGALLRTGIDGAVDDFQVTACTPTDENRCAPGGGTDFVDAFEKLFPSRTDFTLGGFVETEFKLDGRSTIVPGLRVDLHHSLDDTDVAIDPKLAGRFAVGEHLYLVPAVAIASQRPSFAPLPALVIGGIPGGLQRSFQASFGAEVRYGPVEFVAAVFRNATFGLTDAIGTGRGTDFDADRFLRRTQGDTYGLELGAQGALRKDILFLVSYTLSRATRRGEDRRTLPSAYDRTHVAQLALLYDFGGGWRGGFRHVFYSGFPADEVGPGYEPLEDPPRVKPFYRLDARLSKRWSVGKSGWVSLVLDVQNATLSQEVFDVTCTSTGCTPRTIGPVSIPALALEAGF